MIIVVSPPTSRNFGPPTAASVGAYLQHMMHERLRCDDERSSSNAVGSQGRTEPEPPQYDRSTPAKKISVEVRGRSGVTKINMSQWVPRKEGWDSEVQERYLIRYLIAAITSAGGCHDSSIWRATAPQSARGVVGEEVC